MGLIKSAVPVENVNIFGTALMDFFSNLPILGFNAYCHCLLNLINSINVLIEP